MAQSDGPDENSHCLSCGVITNLHSYFGDSHPVNNLISQIQTMRTKETLSSGFCLESTSAQDSGGLCESCDSLNQLDCSPPTDISSALRSVALMRTLDLKKVQCAHVPMLFSVPRLEEDNETLSPLDQDESTDWAADPAEEERTASFQSKFINFFPLYQDYFLQAVRDDLHRLNKSFVSELLTPQHLLGLQGCNAQCHSEATSPRLNPPEEPPSSPLPHLVRVTPCTLWQDLEEVKQSGLLSRLTTREIRLQESMFELIGSEVSYLNSLGVSVNHFYASRVLKQTLTQLEHHVLFSNVRRVMAASEKFLGDLERRLGECALISRVEDVVLQHCSKFRSLYVPYVTNMRYQEDLVNQLLSRQPNRDFQSAIKTLESDPVCQRQSLKSFLVLPFQRITRIKLILESILKLTEPDSAAVSNLEKAIEAIHEIVTECDKGVQKMKQIEELVCLEMLLDFGKVKAVPLVVSGRFLVHQGPMRQLSLEATSRPSFISIYLHLFNDLLILSSKKALRFTVMDHAALASHVHVGHLNTEVLGLPPDSFLLHLSQSHNGQPTAMILAAHTSSDKEVWMKALSSKQ